MQLELFTLGMHESNARFGPYFRISAAWMKQSPELQHWRCECRHLLTPTLAPADAGGCGGYCCKHGGGTQVYFQHLQLQDV
jgi:hypothetical protein